MIESTKEDILDLKSKLSNIVSTHSQLNHLTSSLNMMSINPEQFEFYKISLEGKLAPMMIEFSVPQEFENFTVYMSLKDRFPDSGTY
jgi:hypothetical protein